MRVLVLTCNTGEGHNSAAYAIQDYITERGEKCDVVNYLSLRSSLVSNVISKGHNFLYRHMPTFFGLSYEFEEKHPRVPILDKDSNQNKTVRRRLLRLIQENNYDTIICTHVFPGVFVTNLRKKEKLNINIYFVSTDYTCSPGVVQMVMNAYFIPHGQLREEFVQCGLPRDRLVASGIPVRRFFYTHIEKNAAKKALGLDEKTRYVLLVSGSMGCGPIEELVGDISDILPSDVKLIVICGRNNRLLKELTKKCKKANVDILGYTSRIHEYMDASELIVTKPGGLSTTEAATKCLPMVLMNAVPGLEPHNCDFFVSGGMALTGEENAEIVEWVYQCLVNEKMLEGMRENQKKFFSDIYGARGIYEKVLEDLENNAHC